MLLTVLNDRLEQLLEGNMSKAILDACQYCSIITFSQKHLSLSAPYERALICLLLVMCELI